jgi:16S rRNA (uracil1498-N3)-methyltransferase
MGDDGDGKMKRLPRFAIEAPPDSGGIARVGEEETHHMRDVMRLAPGDHVILIDERGTRYEGAVHEFTRSGAMVRILATDPAPSRPSLIVAAAVIKGPRMDIIVEKAAELGASELRPIVCERCVGRAPGAEKVARWRRLAVAASKQSLVAPPMRVGEVQGFTDMIRSVPRNAAALICVQGGEPICNLAARTKPEAVIIATGPEGDFTDHEVESALEAGFIAADLGPNRLRSETAAIAAIAIATRWMAPR